MCLSEGLVGRFLLAKVEVDRDEPTEIDLAGWLQITVSITAWRMFWLKLAGQRVGTYQPEHRDVLFS